MGIAWFASLTLCVSWGSTLLRADIRCPIFLAVASLSGFIVFGTTEPERNRVNVSTTFDELLNAFWLRPETAMWRELDIQTMSRFKDLGCGDEAFTLFEDTHLKKMREDCVHNWIA